MNANPLDTPATPQTNTVQPIQTPVPYVLPTPSSNQDWSGYALRAFQPTERQRPVIEAVRAALAAELFYSNEIMQFCAQQLCVTPAQAAVGAKRVEGGEFGMDCYYARRYLESREKIAAEDAAHQRLAPRVGMRLGTLRFNDFKRNTGMVVDEVLPDGRLKLRGKRGAYEVTVECTALQVAKAVDRAAERGWRKDRFDTLTIL